MHIAQETIIVIYNFFRKILTTPNYRRRSAAACSIALANIATLLRSHDGINTYIYVAVLLHIESRCRLDLRNNSLHHFIIHRNLKFDLYKVVLSIYIIFRGF